jgi:Resolvase, N terminal domain
VGASPDLVAPLANMLFAALKVAHEPAKQDQSDTSATDGDRLRPPVDASPGARQPESRARQYALVEEAAQLGWPASKIEVIDADLGISGRWAERRSGFREVVSRVCLGEVGAIFGLEVARLARNNADFARLLELAPPDRHAGHRYRWHVRPAGVQRSAPAGLERRHVES